MSLVAKLRRAASEMGLGNALLYGLDQGCQSVGLPCWVRRYLLVAQPVSDRPLLPAGRGKKIEVRRLDPASPALRDLPLTEDVTRARFAQGALCLGALKGDAISGCAWLVFDGYDEDEVRSRFLPEPAAQTAWDFDVYVVPAECFGVALMRLWDGVNAVLRRRGVRWSMSRISAFNRASVASHLRLGAKAVASATYSLGRSDSSFFHFRGALCPSLVWWARDARHQTAGAHGCVVVQCLCRRRRFGLTSREFEQRLP